MRCLLTVGLLAWATTAVAEPVTNLARVNRQLAGRVVDFTKNQGADRRIFSPILGEPRDLYVYLPPGYDPNRSYSLILWLHGAFGDENSFLIGGHLKDLDRRISSGCCPPVIVACPDGTYEGLNRFTAQHSFFVNGLGGRYEDHVMQEVVPFLLENFSVRPERNAHAAVGISGGGFGALVLAIKHRDFFGTVAVLAAPVDMRYNTTGNRYFANFNPLTYAPRVEYDPRLVVGKYFSIVRLRARRLLEPVFGPREEMLENVSQVNPRDLLESENLQPGELDIYLNYPGHDNFNFDSHAESFIWHARQRGIAVSAERDPWARHRILYFRRNLRQLYTWLCPRLPAPMDPQTLEIHASEADATIQSPPATGGETGQ